MKLAMYLSLALLVGIQAASNQPAPAPADSSRGGMFRFRAHTPDPASRRERLARHKDYARHFSAVSASEAERGGTRGIVQREDWMLRLPALPLQMSNHVLIGRIDRVRGFAASGNNDEITGVYTEYDLDVERWLTGHMRSQTVTASRPGGVVRLPSGREIVFRIQGQGQLAAGKRYLLFLVPNTNSDSLRILTGYEIRTGDLVSPVDGRDGAAVQFSKYDGVNLSDLLREIAAPAGP